MKDCIKNISKDEYDEIISQNENGFLSNELTMKHFSPSILYGYGLYGCRAYKTDDGFVLKYSIGNSCD